MRPSERMLDVGRLQLHVVELGSGPPVLFLHGFPAYWEDFRDQMELLAASGFRAIAVDLPGYGQSQKLPEMLDYRAELLTADLAGLVRALGVGRIHVVGHDWGGTLAYCLAADYPELVERLIVINAGHPDVLRRAFRNPEQMVRSWYAYLFQLPWLPEWLVRRRTAVSLAFSGMAVRPGAFSEADQDRYLEALRRPGVARAVVNYYRAAFRAPLRTKAKVLQRTLVLWGEQDRALSAALLLEPLASWVPNARIARFANGGHWLHHDLPEVVGRHVVEFLSATADS